MLGQFDGYRAVPGVDPHSGRDTFVAARVWIDNPRWRDVPFYLRTGKRLAASKQRVSLILREPPGPLAASCPAMGRVLSFSLAGDGEIDLLLVAKKPGPWRWTSMSSARRSRWPACTVPTRCHRTCG